MPRDEVVGYLERYASSFGAPVQEGVAVESLEPGARGGFLLRTSAGELRAERVVVCTGAYQRAHRPPAAAFPPGVPVIDAAGYRNPAALAPGTVLVIGSAIVLMTLMPDADAREVIIALAGDLAMVPWARAWRPASPRAFGDWRAALGPQPLEELQDIVLRASHAEHEVRDWRAVVIGRLKVSSADGTLVRVPDTPANRAAFGSVGTGDDSSPFPQVRALPLNDASTRALLGMPHGPAGTDKAAAEQKLLDTAMEQYPHLFTMDRIWLLDRNFRAPRGALSYRPRSGHGLEEVFVGLMAYLDP